MFLWLVFLSFSCASGVSLQAVQVDPQSLPSSCISFNVRTCHFSLLLDQGEQLRAVSVRRTSLGQEASPGTRTFFRAVGSVTAPLKSLESVFPRVGCTSLVTFGSTLLQEGDADCTSLAPDFRMDSSLLVGSYYCNDPNAAQIAGPKVLVAQLSERMSFGSALEMSLEMTVYLRGAQAIDLSATCRESFTTTTATTSTTSTTTTTTTTTTASTTTPAPTTTTAVATTRSNVSPTSNGGGGNGLTTTVIGPVLETSGPAGTLPSTTPGAAGDSLSWIAGVVIGVLVAVIVGLLVFIIVRRRQRSTNTADLLVSDSDLPSNWNVNDFLPNKPFQNEPFVPASFPETRSGGEQTDEEFDFFDFL